MGHTTRRKIFFLLLLSLALSISTDGFAYQQKRLEVQFIELSKAQVQSSQMTTRNLDLECERRLGKGFKFADVIQIRYGAETTKGKFLNWIGNHVPRHWIPGNWIKDDAQGNPILTSMPITLVPRQLDAAFPANIACARREHPSTQDFTADDFEIMDIIESDYNKSLLQVLVPDPCANRP
jgi:hypothetical protein